MLTAKEFVFTYQLLHLGSIQMLAIWKDKHIGLYRIREFRADAEYQGRAFRLDKLNAPDEAVGAGPYTELGDVHYDVLVSQLNWECRCSCVGFLRYGYCKHLLAVSDLIVDGAI